MQLSDKSLEALSHVGLAVLGYLPLNMLVHCVPIWFRSIKVEAFLRRPYKCNGNTPLIWVVSVEPGHYLMYVFFGAWETEIEKKETLVCACWVAAC